MECSIENSRHCCARRHLLRAALASGAWLVLCGHSPYRQWDVHRKTRLVLLVSRSDERSVVLAKSLAALFAARLPESRASVARARDHNDLLRLLASKQLDVALLREGRYAAGDAPALRALAVVDEHVLVCRDDLPKASAYLLAEALARPRPAGSLSIPFHAGALEYYREHP